jgi:hypothetical protein
MGITELRIINNSLFHNEYDLLELKLSTEYDSVDQFVIVESDHTFTGMYKGFNLPKQMERYSVWWDKVKYVQIGKPPAGSSMQVEWWMRGHFQQQWTDLTKEDVVVITDLDELVRPDAYKFIRETDYDFYRLCMPFFCFKFNFLNIEGHTPWNSVKAFRGYVVQGEDGMRNVQGVPGGKQIELNHAGWHFSYMGDTEWVLNKLRSFDDNWIPENRPELSALDVSTLIKEGKCFWQSGFKFVPVKLDDYFPKAIIDNTSRYSEYILPDTDKSVTDYFPNTTINNQQETV